MNEPSIKQLEQIKIDLEKERIPDQRKLSALRRQIERLQKAEEEAVEEEEKVTVDDLAEEEQELKEKKAAKKKYREAKSKGSKRKHK